VWSNDTFLSSGTLELYTDAAQSKCYSGVYRSQWFYGSFPDDWKTLNIMTLEFYPIILSVEIWGPLWKNHAILLFTDNEALVSVINKQTSKSGWSGYENGKAFGFKMLTIQHFA